MSFLHRVLYSRPKGKVHNEDWNFMPGLIKDLLVKIMVQWFTILGVLNGLE
jgi:hypothetical protein